MNEMQLLERMHDDVTPDPAALLRARRRMLRHALADRPRRGLRVRRGLVGVSVAAAVTVAALVVPTTSDDGGASAAAAAVLDRAVRATDPTVPRADQWVLVRSETLRWYGEVPEPELQETWVPGDLAGETRFRESDGLVIREPVDLPAISTDPDAGTDDVVAWLMTDNGDLRGAEAAFERAQETLAEDAVPVAFKARLLAALTEIDGVRVVDERTAYAGHQAVLLGRDIGHGYESQLAFDRETGAFIGFQGLRDGRLDYRTLMTTEVVDRLPLRARTCVAVGDEVQGFQPPPGCTPGD